MSQSFTQTRGPRSPLMGGLAWSAVTVFWALFAPYVLFGLCMGFVGLLGADMHSWIAMMGTVDNSGWETLGNVWMGFQILLAVVIVFARVWGTLPVRAWRTRMDNAWQRRVDSFGLRVTTRLERTAIVRWMARHQVGVSVVCLGSVVAFLLVLALYAASHQPSSRVPPLPVSRPPAPVKPRASATIVQPNGAIESGEVSLRQVSGQTYEITFVKAR